MESGRMVVVRGHPTAEELAAVTTAVLRHRRARGDRQRRATPTSRWARAARLESRGHPPIDSPATLTR